MNPGPSKEVLINNVIRFEYGAEVLHCLSTPSLGGNEQRQLREKLNRRREKDAMIQRVKEDYKNADKESGTRRFTPLTMFNIVCGRTQKKKKTSSVLQIAVM